MMKNTFLLSILFLLASCGGGKSDNATEPAALTPPQNIKVEKKTDEFLKTPYFSVTWSHPGYQEKPVRFDICVAKEAIKDFTKCATYRGVNRYADMKSPAKLPRGITPGAEYFIVINASSGGQKIPSKNFKITANIPPVAIVEDHYDLPYTERPVYKEGNKFTLNGSESSDPDGNIVKYEWRQSFGPQVEWIERNTATPTFIIPSRKESYGHTHGDTDYDPETNPTDPLAVWFDFELTVTDNNGAQSKEFSPVTTVWFNLDNSPPVIKNISANKTAISPGDTVVLTFEVTDPDGDSLGGLLGDIWINQYTLDNLKKRKIDEYTYSYTVPTLSSDQVTPFRVGADLDIVFEVGVRDSFGALTSENITVTLLAPDDIDRTVSAPKLNDTGMDQCADATLSNRSSSDEISTGTPSPLISCSNLIDTDGDPIPQGQDGHHGRDMSDNAPEDGHAGFSFTKLDSNGDNLSQTAESWSCARDNVTGLIWEAKSTPNGIPREDLHDGDDEYIWYEPDYSINGGSDGLLSFASLHSYLEEYAGCYGYENTKEETWCSTHYFTQRVNQEKLCGFDNWRLPSIEELHSIADYSIENTPSVLSPIPSYPQGEGGIWSSTSTPRDHQVFIFLTPSRRIIATYNAYETGDFEDIYSQYPLILVR